METSAIIIDLCRALIEVQDPPTNRQINAVQGNVELLARRSRDLKKRMEKAEKWFARHGGWGAAPDPKPENYDEYTERYIGWLKEYEHCRAAIRTSDGVMWPTK